MNRERKQRTAATIGFVAVFGLFGYGTLMLLLLRFEAGDIYPEYSSLRADPLGTKAFYEALEHLPGITVRRHRTGLSDLAGSGPAALLFIGVQPSGSDDAPKALVDALEAEAVPGGRVVLAFYPYGTEPWHLREDAEEDNEDKPADEDGAEDTESEEKTSADDEQSPAPAEDQEQPAPETGAVNSEPPSEEKPGGSNDEAAKEDEDDEESRADRLARYRRAVDLAERWGISTDFEPLPEEDGAYKPVTASRQVDLPLPESIPFHSALYFKDLDDAWTALYARPGGNAVLVERQWGSGTLVLCADAYLFSNEAMFADRCPELLAWFIGPCSTVVFDETHLGIAERHGVMTLARKYRLHGVMIVLAVLALLFVWKNAVSLVPRTVPSANAGLANEVTVGKDAASGLANLIRRSVPPSGLPGACVGEFEKSLGHRAAGAAPRPASGTPRLSGGQINRMRAVVSDDGTRPALRRDPVGSYRALHRIVNERKPGRAATADEPVGRTTEKE